MQWSDYFYLEIFESAKIGIYFYLFLSDTIHFLIAQSFEYSLCENHLLN